MCRYSGNAVSDSVENMRYDGQKTFITDKLYKCRENYEQKMNKTYEILKMFIFRSKTVYKFNQLRYTPTRSRLTERAAIERLWLSVTAETNFQT